MAANAKTVRLILEHAGIQRERFHPPVITEAARFLRNHEFPSIERLNHVWRVTVTSQNARAWCERVATWYGESGLRPAARISAFDRPRALRRAFEQTGFVAAGEWRLMIHDPRGPRRPVREDAEVANIDARSPHAEQWVNMASRLGDPSDPAPDGSEYRRFLRRELQLPGTRHYLCRDSGGEPVACGMLFFADHMGAVDHLVTAPHKRGQGYARVILARALDDARSLGCRITYLITGKDDGSASRACRSQGFTDVATTPAITYLWPAQLPVPAPHAKGHAAGPP